MSRYYGMHIEVTGSDPSRVKSVKNAAAEQWPFEDWEYRDPILSSYAESKLTGGESEEEFTDRLAASIWKANRAYCQIVVEATYLEEVPHETHLRDEDAYRTWLREIGERDKCR